VPLRAEFIGPTAIHEPLGACNDDALNKIPVATNIAAVHRIITVRFIE
jgi:hypothetical protein